MTTHYTKTTQISVMFPAEPDPDRKGIASIQMGLDGGDPNTTRSAHRAMEEAIINLTPRERQRLYGELMISEGGGNTSEYSIKSKIEGIGADAANAALNDPEGGLTAALFLVGNRF